MDREVILRVEAKARGLVRYFTGEPCKRGPLAERQVSSKACLECKREREASRVNENSERRRRWRQAHPEKDRASRRRWYEANREKHTEGVRRWREANEEKAREYNRKSSRQWRGTNLEKAREATRLWTRENREKCNAKDARRRATKLAATPNLTPAQDREVRQHYVDARMGAAFTGQPFEVDHIIPLASGGLHTPDNLMPIPAMLNAGKGARDPHEFATENVAYRKWFDRVPVFNQITYVRRRDARGIWT